MNLQIIVGSNNLQKVLIIRFGSLGDVLLTTPLLRILKNKYPELIIDYLVKKNFADAIRYNPYINKIIEFEYSGENRIIKSLKASNYDVVIDLQNNLRSKKFRLALGVKAFKFRKPTIKKFLLVNFKINFLHPATPIPERYLKAFDELEIDSEGLEFYFPEKEMPEAKENTEFIGLCPGSKHFTKMYPAEYFIKLGNMLNEAGYRIKVLGGKDERSICRSIAGSIESALDLSNDNNLFATAREIKTCKTVICNDSGLMHLAAAVKTPVVALFGSTVKEFGFAPYKVKSLILENNSLNCRPCSHIGKNKCPKGHFKCMLELKPDLIFNKIKEFLDTV